LVPWPKIGFAYFVQKVEPAFTCVDEGDATDEGDVTAALTTAAPIAAATSNAAGQLSLFIR
jgi:hypothetical protein